MSAERFLSLIALVLLLVPAAPAVADGDRWVGAQRGANPVRSFLEMRQENVVIQKWDLSCGAAALATILRYQHNDPVPERTIAGAMLGRTDPLRVKNQMGFSLLDLKRYAENRGYKATGYAELTIQNLVEFGPTIVPVRLKGYNHFVVFRGLKRDRVLLADPAYGNRSMRLVVFEEAWVGKLGFVVRRPSEEAGPGQLAVRPGDFSYPAGATLRRVLR